MTLGVFGGPGAARWWGGPAGPSERDVLVVGRLVGGGARLGAVLEVDAVDLVGDALLARARLVRARLEPAGEGDGLALDQVLAGRLGLALPEDQVDVDRVGLAVAAVAGHRDGGD